MQTKPTVIFIRDVVIMTALAAGLVIVPMFKDEWLPTVKGATSNSSMLVVEAVGSSEGKVDAKERREDKEFIRSVFPAIFEWDANHLEPHLDPVTRSEIDSNDIARVMNTLDVALGELEDINEPVFTGSTVDSQVGELASYELTAEFDRGIADIEIVLSEAGGEQTIYMLDVDVI